MELKNMKRFLGIWLLGAIATVAILAILTAGDHGWSGYFKLVLDGNTCEGTITKTEPKNHCHAEYSFSIGGRNYAGTGSDCSAGIGQTVRVTYLPANPSYSCLGSAQERLTNEVMTFVAGGIIFPPFLMLAYRMRKKEKQKMKGDA